MKLLRRLWLFFTYIPVACDGCDGTGICTAPNPSWPHSCCGDCGRKSVPATEVPKGFRSIYNDEALIGDGIMYVRPWATNIQVNKPKL